MKDPTEEMAVLIATLYDTEQRLDQLTGGELDTVADSQGRTFLLRRAQDELRVSEARKQGAILNALPAHIALLDPQGIIVSVNEAWRRFANENVLQGPGYGVGVNYLETCDTANGTDPAEARLAAEGIRSVLNSGLRTFTLEYPCHSPAVQRWFLMTVTPLSEHHPNGAVVMHLDITERRRAESELRESEAEFRTLAEAMPQIVWITRPDGWNIYFNQRWIDYTGMTLDESVGTGWTKPFHPEDRDRAWEAWKQATTSLGTYSLEARLRRSDGAYRWWLVRGAPLQDAAGNVVKWFGTCTDIDDLKVAEQNILDSREMFRLIAESTNAVPFKLDLTRGRFVYIGAQGVSNSGIPESNWSEPGALDAILPRASNPELRKHLDECQSGPFEFVSAMSLSNNRHSEVRWTGTCEMVAETKILRGLTLDITEHRRLGRQLQAAQKLESVGRLAAGVAHEINTPVQFVSDNVQFVSKSMSGIAVAIHAYRQLLNAVRSQGDVAAAAHAAEEAEKFADLDYLMQQTPLALESSVEGLSRIATIVRSMKEFAHPDGAQKIMADLNQAIRSTLVVARNEYKYVAELDAQFADLPPVMCHLGEINQVILNLLVNASHAIADVVKGTDNLGKLTVRTRLDGNAVEISIADTGTGIPEFARDRIFDPFFTTKEVGTGTGQGLALAHSVIVRRHGGTVRFETECGKGSTFFIRLPINEAVEK